jgi:hypothetical protein
MGMRNIGKTHSTQASKKIINDKIPIEINIPVFHNSIIPRRKQKNQESANYFIYSM